MCEITINCADGSGNGGGSTGYEEVIETIPVGSPAEPFVQVDAPEGKFVVNFFLVALDSPQPGDVGPFGVGIRGRLVRDTEGRITGLLCERAASTPYEAHIVCVNG
jgi:hypothetical protein